MTQIVAIADISRNHPTLEDVAHAESDGLFYVYVLGNETTGKLAVSMTQNLQACVLNQKNNVHPRDITSRYALHSLVHVEEFSDICAALKRYNDLSKKDADGLSWLIECTNPDWEDLLLHITNDDVLPKP